MTPQNVSRSDISNWEHLLRFSQIPASFVIDFVLPAFLIKRLIMLMQCVMMLILMNVNANNVNGRLFLRRMRKKQSLTSRNATLLKEKGRVRSLGISL